MLFNITHSPLAVTRRTTLREKVRDSRAADLLQKGDVSRWVWTPLVIDITLICENCHRHTVTNVINFCPPNVITPFNFRDSTRSECRSTDQNQYKTSMSLLQGYVMSLRLGRRVSLRTQKDRHHE